MERLKREARDPHFYPLLLPTNEWNAAGDPGRAARRRRC